MAHRGGAALYPENTLVAFELAVRKHHMDALELDLHATRDGVLVVSHDETVDRCTDGRGAISQLSLAEVQRLDAGHHTAYRRQGVRVPTFEELLLALPQTPLNIELKPETPGLELELKRVLEKHGAIDRVCLGSEKDVVGERLAEVLPQACHFHPAGAAMQLGAGIWGFAPLEKDPRYTVLAIPRVFDGRVITDAAFLATTRKLGVPVFVWVVDEPEEMQQLIRDGASGIMTDRPDVLDTVLHRAG